MANQVTLKDKNVKIGDTVKLRYKFKDGDKEKMQFFEGVLMKIRGEGDNKMITIRKVTKDKIGVERIIPVISPFVDNVEVTKKASARRAKLYFIRKLSDRALRERLS